MDGTKQVLGSLNPLFLEIPPFYPLLSPVGRDNTDK